MEEAPLVPSTSSSAFRFSPLAVQLRRVTFLSHRNHQSPLIGTERLPCLQIAKHAWFRDLAAADSILYQTSCQAISFHPRFADQICLSRDCHLFAPDLLPARPLFLVKRSGRILVSPATVQLAPTLPSTNPLPCISVSVCHPSPPCASTLAGLTVSFDLLARASSPQTPFIAKKRHHGDLITSTATLRPGTTVSPLTSPRQPRPTLTHLATSSRVAHLLTSNTTSHKRLTFMEAIRNHERLLSERTCGGRCSIDRL